MGGSEEIFGSLDLLHVESGIFFLLLARMMAHSWQKIHSMKVVQLPLRPSFWIALILLVVLSLSAVFIMGFGEIYMLLGIEFAMIIGLSLLGPMYSITFFVSLLFLRPWEILNNNSLMLAMPRFMGIFSIAMLLLASLMRVRLKIVWNKSTLLMLFFTLWLFITAFFKAGEEQQSDYLNSFTRVAIVYFMIVNAIDDMNDYRLLRDCLLISAAGLGAIALYKHFTLVSNQVSAARLTAVGNLENSNDLAAILIMALPIAIRPLMEKSITISKILQILFFTGLTLTAVWLSQSRGAILAMLVMGGCYFLFRMQNKKKAILLALLIGLSFIPLRSLLNRDSNDIQESTESRMEFWKSGVKMAFYNPVMGVGFGNFPNKFEQYADEIKYEYGKRTAHSTWILVLAENGFPALIALLAIFWIAIKEAYSLREIHPDLIYSLIGYTVAITFLSHTYILYPYILLAITTAAARVYKNNVQKEKLMKIAASVLLVFFTSSAYFFLPLTSNAAELSAAEGGNKPIGKESPVTTNELKLFASRGETVNFLLKLTDLKQCTRLWVDADNLNKVDQAERWKKIKFRFFEMPKIKTIHSSFPEAFMGEHLDPLVPIMGGRICNPGWIWGEMEVDRATSAGQMEGQIRLENGPEISWKAEIWPMAINEFPHLPAYSELTTWFNLLGHYGAWHEGEGALAQKYLAAMKEHRIYPLKSAVKRPQVKIQAGGRFTLDTKDYPNTPESFEKIVLQNDAHALIDFPSFPSQTNAEENARYWKAVENTILENHLENRAISYFWDEPKEKDFPKLIREAKIAKKFAPHLKLLVTTEYDKKLTPYVDIFSPVMNYFDTSTHASAKDYKTWQKSGKLVWWYVSCMSHGCSASREDPGYPDMVIDRSAAYIRSIAWLSEKYGINAFLYYSVNNGYQYYPKRDPWKSLWDFHGNADGTLFYPGRPGMFTSILEHEPVASIRLKLWRESSFDAEYIHWMNQLKKKPIWWQTEWNKLVQDPKNFSKNYNEYQSLRNKVGQYLATQEELTGAKTP